MRAAVDGIRQQFGALHGVIHASGLQSSRSLLERTVEEFQEILAPKIQGTLVLDEVLRDVPLDFVCYFSSASAVIGDFGSCDYAVANRFQIAHARVCNERATGPAARTVCVINWPLWREGGMGMPDEAATELYLKSSGQRALDTEAGLRIFERILAQGCGQRLVMKGDATRLRRLVSHGSTSDLQPAVVSTPADHIGAELRELAGGLLGAAPDRLDMEENLANLGFDSIGLTQLAARLSQRFAIPLRAGVFFRYPSLARLTEFLRQTLDKLQGAEEPPGLAGTPGRAARAGSVEEPTARVQQQPATETGA
jgi:acyl carrier protein